MIITVIGSFPSKKVQKLIEYCRANGRVCPMPVHWDALWKLLPKRRRVGPSWEPLLPLILGAWWYENDQSKRERLTEHILWAEQHGVLSAIDTYLRELPEGDWHHEDD